jgi:hypothetical protein
MMKKWVLIIIGLLVCAYLLVNTFIIVPKVIPDTFPALNSQIVYGDSSHGISIIDGNNNFLGFWELRIPIYDPFIIKRYAGYITPYFTWSRDGQRIVFRVSNSSPEGGYPGVIDLQGNIQYCPMGSIWGNGRAWLVEDNIILSDAYIDKESIILFDIGKCKLVKILHEEPSGIIIADVAISKENILAFERYHIGEGSELVVLNPDGTTNISIKGGLNPSWSKDGALLIYTDLEKGIVIYDMHSNTQSVITDSGVDWDTMTSLSDDNRYMVYNGFINNKMMLVLVDIETNEQRLLAEGYYPNWRWEH